MTLKPDRESFSNYGSYVVALVELGIADAADRNAAAFWLQDDDKRDRLCAAPDGSPYSRWP